ncbi:DivIVA domain-containing protein [Actinoplanes sp. NPDC026619]|uniref:DivIVA domain-containing protein n=1 Tax=Actinoplanes sp. NPDC026619 TaxID=3155798 RepID=UPI0033C236FB
MPLTPADIHNMEFRKSSIGRRGYDEEEVDSLLDAVSHEMIKLLEENDMLRERARLADAAAPPRENLDGAAEAELSAVSDELNRARQACDRAEQNAQSLHGRLTDARRAAATPAPAPTPAPANDRVLAVAQRTADQHMNSAHQHARELLQDANAESERITEDARKMAFDLGEDSQRRDSDALVELETRHIALQKQVSELALFAENYRAALVHHIRRQDEI